MIPSYTKKSIDRYVQDRIPTGGFLHAVLSNDLFKAFEKADDNNRTALFNICAYIYSQTPSACWGSPQIVKNWLANNELAVS